MFLTKSLTPFLGHNLGEADSFKLLGERLELQMEQMVQKFQQVMEHKQEVQAIRFQQAMDRVDSLGRKIEHVEWVQNSRFQQAKTDWNRLFEDKFRELLKLQSHLQLKQNQLAVKQDLLRTTIVGDNWSMPTPTISSPPCRSPTFHTSSTTYQSSRAISTLHPSAQPRPLQSHPIPSASITSHGDKPMSKSYEEDLDEDLLSF